MNDINDMIQKNFLYRTLIVFVTVLLIAVGSGCSQKKQEVNAASLYQSVEEYSRLGIHRVGTEVDAHTIDWFAGKLTKLGGKVERQPFDFSQYQATSKVMINGIGVPSIPLYYEATGKVDSNHPYVASAVVMTGGRTSQALKDTITDAKKSGADIAVIATENPSGELATPDRYPKPGSGLPVVLVPGRYADALKDSKVSVSFNAKLVPGKSENVVASFGDVSNKPIVIATPLSGWFTSSAERGTGIAIALGLAHRLASKYPVVVVGSSGHEILHHIGLEDFLKHNKVDASLIVQLDADVAFGEKDPVTGKITLAPGSNDPKAKPVLARTLFVRMDPGVFEKMKPLLMEADLPAVLNPPRWNGEGALWAGASSSPLMSFSGTGPLLHTPEDVTENVTSPEILEQVYSAIGTAVETYITPR